MSVADIFDFPTGFPHVTALICLLLSEEVMRVLSEKRLALTKDEMSHPVPPWTYDFVPFHSLLRVQSGFTSIPSPRRHQFDDRQKLPTFLNAVCRS